MLLFFLLFNILFQLCHCEQDYSMSMDYSMGDDASMDDSFDESMGDACNDPCPEGYFKDATYDTMCIGDNWNGKYCSLCGGDNGGWVMDPCTSIDQKTTESIDDPAESTQVQTTTLPETTVPTGSDFFTMFGDCDVHDDCVSSSNYPSPHGHGESCSIRMLQDASVSVGFTFDLETCCDHLMIRGFDVQFASAVPSSLNAWEIFSWTSDGSIARNGWQLCFAPLGGTTGEGTTKIPETTEVPTTTQLFVSSTGPSVKPTHSPTVDPRAPSAPSAGPSVKPTRSPIRDSRAPSVSSAGLSAQPTRSSTMTTGIYTTQVSSQTEEAIDTTNEPFDGPANDCQYTIDVVMQNGLCPCMTQQLNCPMVPPGICYWEAKQACEAIAASTPSVAPSMKWKMSHYQTTDGRFNLTHAPTVSSHCCGTSNNEVDMSVWPLSKYPNYPACHGGIQHFDKQNWIDYGAIQIDAETANDGPYGLHICIGNAVYYYTSVDNKTASATSDYFIIQDGICSQLTFDPATCKKETRPAMDLASFLMASGWSIGTCPLGECPAYMQQEISTAGGWGDLTGLTDLADDYCASRNDLTISYRCDGDAFTERPSVAPSIAPSSNPSSMFPSRSPSTEIPSMVPSTAPTSNPSSMFPSRSPSTEIPSMVPSTAPTSDRPSMLPSYMPSTNPSSIPSTTPSTDPSKLPTESPTWSDVHNVVPERFYTNNLYADVVQDETSKASFLEQCTIFMKDFKLECYDIQENLLRGGKAILLLEGLPNAIETQRASFQSSGIKIGEFPLLVPYESDSPSVSPSVSLLTSSPSISTSLRPNPNEVVLDLEVSGLTSENKQDALDAITKALLSFFDVEHGVASVVSHNLEGIVMETEAIVRMKFHVIAKQEATDLNARIRKTSDEVIVDEVSLGLLDEFVFGVEIKAVNKPLAVAPAEESSSNSGTPSWAIIIVSILAALFFCAILFFWFRESELPAKVLEKDLENQWPSKRKPSSGEVLVVRHDFCPRNNSGADTFLQQNDTPKLHECGLTE